MVGQRSVAKSVIGVSLLGLGLGASLSITTIALEAGIGAAEFADNSVNNAKIGEIFSQPESTMAQQIRSYGFFLGLITLLGAACIPYVLLTPLLDQAEGVVGAIAGGFGWILSRGVIALANVGLTGNLIIQLILYCIILVLFFILAYLLRKVVGKYGQNTS